MGNWSGFPGSVRRDDQRGHHLVDGQRAIPALVPELGEAAALVQDVAPRFAETPPLVEAAKAAVQGAVGGFLEVRVERGVDGEAALVQLLRTVLPLEILAHLLDEERRDRLLGRRLPPHLDRPLRRGVRLGLRDVAFFGHPLQDVVAAPHGPPHVDVRALPLGRLDDAGDERRFVQRQVLRSLVEVEPGGGFDAVRAVAEVDLIAVEREDLPLGVALLDLDGEEGLLDLPLPGLLVIEEQLAGQLLGEGAGAGQPPLDDVFDRRHHDPRHDDAEVAIEIGVLGREDGLAQPRRDVLVLDHDPALRRELADDPPVGRVDAGDRVRRVVVQGGDLRQVARIGKQDPGDDPEHRRQDEEGDDQGAAGNADDDVGHGGIIANRPPKQAKALLLPEDTRQRWTVNIDNATRNFYSNRSLKSTALSLFCRALRVRSDRI